MKEILDLRYFGSVVRSDADNASDVDVLCITSNRESGSEYLIEQFLDPKIISDRVLDISYYGESRIIEMWGAGHLFAWHIYLESKPVMPFFGFVDALGKPADYIAADEDVSRLKTLIEDVKESLLSGSKSINYEAGLLYVAARNVAISASWYSENGINFSRYSPYSLRFERSDCLPSVTLNTYNTLCSARHASMRSTISPDLSRIDLIEVCDKLVAWVDSVLAYIRRKL